MKLFGLDIAKIVDGAISSGLNEVEVSELVNGQRDPNKPSDGLNPTFNTLSVGQGVLTQDDEELKNNQSVSIGDKQILIVLNSLVPQYTPKIGDYVLHLGITYRIIDTDVDPAEATITCQLNEQAT